MPTFDSQSFKEKQVEEVTIPVSLTKDQALEPEKTKFVKSLTQEQSNTKLEKGKEQGDMWQTSYKSSFKPYQAENYTVNLRNTRKNK